MAKTRKQTARKLNRLAPAQLYLPCDAALFDFDTTDALEDLADIVGQAGAAEAIQFGVGVRRDGYNIFVMGPAGSGRHTLALQELVNQARAMPKSRDWCYLNNFEQPHKPRAVSLPAGRGGQFVTHMREFVEELRGAIPTAFESEEYRSRSEALNEEFKQRQEKALEDFGMTSREQGIALIQTPSGFALAPLKDNEVVTPDEFEKLPEDEQQRMRQLMEQFEESLRKLTHQFPRWRREHQTRLRELNRETISQAADHLIDELRAQFSDLPEIIAFLDALRADISDNVGELRDSSSPETVSGVTTINPLQRYLVNLVVSHEQDAGAPVVYENHPTYQNLTGRIEHIAHMGTLLTNFSLIKGGALHRANGGFLLLDAGKLLTQPFAWDGLKRALLSREIRIESLGEVYGLVNTLSLQPEPIPLDVKVVLIGERLFYYLLHQLDHDFADLFKVSADFEEDVPRTPENSLLYARMIATMLRRRGLRPFDRAAVARTIEHSARLAEDAARLAPHMRTLSDLLIEADHFATQAGRATVCPEDVQAAIDAQVRRADRLRKEHLRNILNGTVLIDTSGLHAGQINGLGAINLGNLLYAQPVRITATTRLGEGSVIDIEREVELGGAIHSKGVLILTSFLAARYAHSTPLSLNASLVFEQSYSAVEGDSASLAELCALLSALSGLPIDQGLAVTGSVNQFGQVQAIGAVNEKIEGFYDVCAARGLSGTQGVLIPTANIKHLMLRRDVVEAVAAGTFHVYGVENVDEAMEILTGVPAGAPDDEGNVPEGSVNFLVASQLIQLSIMRKNFAGAAPRKRRTPRK